jgi:hypothetical protein
MYLKNTLTIFNLLFVLVVGCGSSMELLPEQRYDFVVIIYMQVFDSTNNKPIKNATVMGRLCLTNDNKDRCIKKTTNKEGKSTLSLFANIPKSFLESAYMEVEVSKEGYSKWSGSYKDYDTVNVYLKPISGP